MQIDIHILMAYSQKTKPNTNSALAVYDRCNCSPTTCPKLFFVLFLLMIYLNITLTMSSLPSHFLYLFAWFYFDCCMESFLKVKTLRLVIYTIYLRRDITKIRLLLVLHTNQSIDQLERVDLHTNKNQTHRKSMRETTNCGISSIITLMRTVVNSYV